MTAPRFTLSEDGAVVISHTVATLNARAMFARLRSLAARAGMPPDDRAELQEELDTLVDQTADVLWAFAGTVDEATHDQLEDERKGLENDNATLSDEKDAEEKRADEAEAQIEELRDAATDAPEELLSKYTALALNVEKMREKCQRADEQIRNVTRAFARARREAGRSEAAKKALDVAERLVNEAAAKVLP